MIKSLLLLFLITTASAGYAQEDMVFPKFRLGFTPSALVNINPGLQLSVDRRINEKLNFSLESAFIMSTPNNAKGFRVRPGVEFFVARSSWVSLVTGFHYNYRFTVDYNERRRIASNGEFDFIQYDTENTLSIGGLNVENKLMFKINKRAYIDLGGGIGLGVIRNRTSAPDPQFNTALEIGAFDTNFTLPGAIFYTHLNFSYAIGI